MTNATAMAAERESKGLPAAVGMEYRYDEVTDNYNQVRW
jgi:hypothetical protein